MALSKRNRMMREKIDKERSYSVEEAVKLFNDTPGVKFRQSMDVVVRLGIDPKKSEQSVRGSAALPHGTGKDVRVAVFAEGDAAAAARDAQADIVGMDDLAEKIRGGEMNFDVVIAAPDAMQLVGKLGQLLGPRGLMPNPKNGTVARDVGAAVKSAKAGQLLYRTDRYGLVHGAIGRADFSVGEIRDNLQSLLDSLKKAKPANAKGTYLRSVHLSPTMGPSVRIDLSQLEV